MNVTTKTKVYLNEKDGKTWYTISDGSKDVNENWTNKSYRIRFKKGEEPQSESKIEITNAFFTYFKAENGITYTTIQCMEWKYLEQPKDEWDYNDYSVKTEEDEPFADSKKIDVESSDLPF